MEFLLQVSLTAASEPFEWSPNRAYCQAILIVAIVSDRDRQIVKTIVTNGTVIACRGSKALRIQMILELIITRSGNKQAPVAFHGKVFNNCTGSIR